MSAALSRFMAALDARGCRQQGKDFTCPAHEDNTSIAQCQRRATMGAFSSIAMQVARRMPCSLPSVSSPKTCSPRTDRVARGQRSLPPTTTGTSSASCSSRSSGSTRRPSGNGERTELAGGSGSSATSGGCYTTSRSFSKSGSRRRSTSWKGRRTLRPSSEQAASRPAIQVVSGSGVLNTRSYFAERESG